MTRRVPSDPVVAELQERADALDAVDPLAGLPAQFLITDGLI